MPGPNILNAIGRKTLQGGTLWRGFTVPVPVSERTRYNLMFCELSGSFLPSPIRNNDMAFREFLFVESWTRNRGSSRTIKWGESGLVGRVGTKSRPLKTETHLHEQSFRFPGALRRSIENSCCIKHSPKSSLCFQGSKPGSN